MAWEGLSEKRTIMTVLENVTSGINLMTTTFNSGISIFSQEPLVYFVGAGLFILAVMVVKRIVMPRKH